MTAKSLRYILLVTIGIYAATIAVGVLLRAWSSAGAATAYATYKDLIPLIIAIPAAYLAFCFQRRNSYMQALRSLWESTTRAVAVARTYTDTPHPIEEKYVQALEALSVVIDQYRGVFRNIPTRQGHGGWFPFEPIRQIYWEIRDLGYGEPVTEAARQHARDRIEEMWKRSREQLLAEFDRDVPTSHHAEYVLPVSPNQRADGFRVRGG
jgi:hypothetical protein